MGTGKFSGKHNEMQGANLAMDWHPIQGGNSNNTPSHLKKSGKAMGSFGLSTDFKFFLYLNLRNYTHTFQEIQLSWPPIVALCPSLIFKLCLFFSLQNYGTPWRHIWTSPAVWAIIVAHFCNNWGFYTFLTCLPSYFKEVLNFSISKVSLSYLTAFLCQSLNINYN